MPSSGSCLRCFRPLDVESESGLCRTCQIAVDTSRASENQEPAATPDPDRTPSYEAGAAQLPPTGGGGVEERGTLSFPPGKPPAKLPPAPLGYELIRELDKGGMGVVYLAREQATNRLVAMKFLLGVANGPAVDRFLAEVRALAALDHPNIVRVLATDFYRADPYFTMEYLPGGTLADLVEARGTLPPQEAAELIRVVAGAVRVAHAHPDRIIHRDIKPSNVLLAKDGSPKLSDFGLAKRSLQDDGITTHTGPIGTPGYMPPEQVSSQWGEVSVASDVYSLGATLYYLLTGQPPFRGRDKIDTMNKVPRELPVRPRVHCPEIPLALEAIVMKCLEKKPADRYPSADEFIADLENYRDGKPTRALPLTRWRRARLRVRRNRRALVGAVGMLVVLGMVFILGTAQRRWADSGDKPRDEPLHVAPQGTPVVGLPAPRITHEDVRKRLQLGEEVHLIDADGPTVPVVWEVGGCDVVPAKYGDSKFSLRSPEEAILRLMTDPGVDRYQIRTLIRQDMLLRDAIPKVPLSYSLAGVSVAHDRVRATDELDVHLLVTGGFCDADPYRRAVLADRVYVTGPLKPLQTRVVAATEKSIQPPPDATSWRAVEIDCTPTGIMARVDGEELTLLSQVIRSARAEPGKLELKDLMRAGVTLPAFSPRRPIGLWASHCWMSVKSLTIRPLP